MSDEIQTALTSEVVTATTPGAEPAPIETTPVAEATPPPPASDTPVPASAQSSGEATQTMPPVETTPIPPSVTTQSGAEITSQPTIRSLLAKAVETIRFRKRAKLEKIIQFTTKHGSVTNDQVEKLLHVSDSTATRYLAELVRNGRLKRSGPTNHAVYQAL